MIAVLLRFTRLDYLELFGDEIDAGYQSYSLMMTGRDYRGNFLPLYAHSFSEWRAPMMMYFMVPFIKIFGLNEWGVRSFSSFFGIISLLGFYFLLLKLGVSKRKSLIGLFLVSITPWHIQYSRSGFEITLMSTFILWGFYFLIDYFNKRKYYKLILSALLLSLSFYTYNTANVYVPLLILLLFTSRRITTKEQVIKPSIILLSLMLILSLPILYQIFFASGAERFNKVSLFNSDSIVSEINEYRKDLDYSFISKVFYNKIVYSTRKITANYLNAFSSDFLFGMGDVTFRHSLHKTGNLFWIYSLFLIFGLASFVKNKNKRFGDYFLLGFLLISPIPSSLTIDGAYHATRLFLMIFPLCYFSALGLESVWDYKKNIGIFTLLVLLLEFSYFQHYYWNSYRKDSWRWWQYGYKEALEELIVIENKYDKVLIENTYEPALPRYLFWSAYQPSKVFNLIDNMDSEEIENYKGFCLNEKICFVNYGDKIFESSQMRDNTLYFLSHPRNIGGDWDWGNDAPKGVEVIKTVRSLDGNPLFYLVTKKL